MQSNLPFSQSMKIIITGESIGEPDTTAITTTSRGNKTHKYKIVFYALKPDLILKIPMGKIRRTLRNHVPFR